LLAALALGAAWLLWAGPPASAGSPPPIIVTTTADVVDAGDGELSLREAVAVAEADGIDAPIQLEAATSYQLDRCGPETGDWVADNEVNGLDHHGPAPLSVVGGTGTILEQTCPATEVLDVEGPMHLMSLAVTGGSGGDWVDVGASTGDVTALSSWTAMTLDDVHLHGNDPDDGAQWVAFANGPMSVTDSLVEDHHVPEGGYLGWVLQGDPLTITDSVLRENTGSIGVVLGSPLEVTRTEVRANQTWVAALDTDCDLTLTDSVVVGNAGTGSTWWEPYGDEPTGAALFARGVATVQDSTISDNTSAYDAGAINAGAVRASDSTFDGNHAAGRGGAIEAEPFDDISLFSGRESWCGPPPVVLDGSIELDGVEVSDSTAADGAALYAEGSILLRDSSVTGSATVEPDPDGDVEQLVGNVVMAEQVDLLESEVSGNDAETGFVVYAADLSATDVVAHGNTGEAGVLYALDRADISGAEISGNRSGYGPLAAGCDVLLQDGSVSENESTWAAAGGGAVSAGYRAYATTSTLSGNSAAGDGGAVWAPYVSVVSTDVLDNDATRDGGGLATSIEGPHETCDEGIEPLGELYVDESTLDGNEAGGDGGGAHAMVRALALRSTISGNEAEGSGGGLASDFRVQVVNSTVTSNVASVGGGVAVLDAGDEAGLSLMLATVSSNRAGEADDLSTPSMASEGSAIGSPQALGGDCSVGDVTSLGGNVVVDPACAEPTSDDLVVPSLQLGDLADNGGTTLTRLPDPASPVVDALGIGCGYTDQLGQQRGPGATPCDAGAVESPWVRFRDVSSAHPFFDEISQLAADGVIAGYDDGTFRPSATVSRQAAVAWLYRLSGSPDVALPAPPTFPDVGASHPFVTEVEWAASAGVTQGYSDGTFRPSAGVTRQALVAWLFDLVGPDVDPPTQANFEDVSPGHPFFAEVEWAASEGLVNGYGDGTFRPGQTITRQAAAAILDRARPFL
jgi:hypothetical protein